MVIMDRLQGRDVVADEAQDSWPERFQRLENRHRDGALLHRHPEVPVVVVQKLLDGFPALFKHVHQFWKR